MTLVIKELHKLNINIAVLTILITCLGIAMAIVISMTYGSTLFTTLFSSSSEEVIPVPITDLGSVSGFVMSSDGLPVDGASVLIYKQMGLIDSADKNAGYFASELTKSDGSYSFDNLPSGVYKFTVTYPDNTIQILDSYAVWPSTSSSYVFVTE
jgi:hypothetical protein